MPEGRESPPPERQTGAQLNSPPASGQGTDKVENKPQVNEDQLKVRIYSRLRLLLVMGGFV